MDDLELTSQKRGQYVIGSQPPEAFPTAKAGIDDRPYLEIYYQKPARFQHTGYFANELLKVEYMIHAVRENHIYAIVGKLDVMEVSMHDMLVSFAWVQIQADGKATTVDKRLDLPSQSSAQAQDIHAD